MRRLARLLLLAWAAPACAGQAPGPVAAAIFQTARAIAPPGARIALGPVAGAAAMPPCPGPITVTISGIAPYEQAAAQCAAPAWTLYVTVTVTVSQAVVIATDQIAAGSVLRAADLAIATRPVSAYAGRQVFYDPASLAGTLAVMALSPGTIITQDDIQAPVLVNAGQTVSVDVISGSVHVEIVATADETGRLGDTILLTNPSSGRRFTALVTANGLVVRLQS